MWGSAWTLQAVGCVQRDHKPYLHERHGKLQADEEKDLIRMKTLYPWLNGSASAVMFILTLPSPRFPVEDIFGSCSCSGCCCYQRGPTMTPKARLVPSPPLSLRKFHPQSWFRDFFGSATGSIIRNEWKNKALSSWMPLKSSWELYWVPNKVASSVSCGKRIVLGSAVRPTCLFISGEIFRYWILIHDAQL